MKNTVVTFREAKQKGEKLTMLTAYDYSTAKLIDEAGVTLDEEERNAILEQACARANELCPAAPLFLETGLRAYNSDLKGVEVSQSGTIYFDRVSW